MTKILIDNATISSVERALGKAPLKEPALLDIEHVALSRFSEAVLLSNGVIIPDNYKADLTPSRKTLINTDLFHFQESKKNEDVEIVEICNSLLGIWREAFHAGSDRSFFSEYFSQVEAFSKFIWEYSSSDGKNILVQKGLEDRSVRITPPTTILGIKIEGDDSSIKLRIPSVLYKKYFIGRKYRAFVKRVMEELAVPAQYGNLKTKLNSYAWVQEDRFPKFYLRQDRFPFKFHKPFTTASLEPSQVEKHNNSGAAD